MCIIEQIHIDINDMGERFLSGEQIYDMSKTKTGGNMQGYKGRCYE